MSQFLNHVTIAAPRNGSATHTVTPSSGTVVAGSAFTPTAGRLLVVVVEGAVTSTTPADWTLPSGGSAINNTGLYVWYRTAAGSDSLTTTHNGSDYPVVFDFYEYPATATWVGVVSATAVNPGGGAGPMLSGLTGTNQVYAVGGQGTSALFAGPWAGSWSAGTEIVDTSAAYATTDGYTFGVSEFVDYASSTASAAWTSTNGSGATVERLVWAVNVPVAGDPPVPNGRSNRMLSEALPRGGAGLWSEPVGAVYLQRLFPATTVTGTIAVSLPLTAATISGASTNSGTLTASAPLVTSNISEVVATNTGTLAASLPRTTATLTGTQTDTGTLAASAPLLTATMTGTAKNTGTLAASTIRATSTLTGTSTDAGSLAASAPVVTASFTGASTNTATLSASAPLVTASIADTTSVTGTLSSSLPRITATLAGTQVNTGTMSASTPRATFSATGTVVNSGTMAASVIRPTATIAGTMTNGATMTTATVVPVAALTGSSTNAAALTVSTPRLTMQASGSVVNVGALVASTPAVTVLISGMVINGATLTAALPLVTFATINAYLPLVDADHMRMVPARGYLRTVAARDATRTVPARGATLTVEARNSTHNVPARPHVRRVT